MKWQTTSYLFCVMTWQVTKYQFFYVLLNWSQFSPLWSCLSDRWIDRIISIVDHHDVTLIQGHGHLFSHHLFQINLGSLMRNNWLYANQNMSLQKVSIFFCCDMYIVHSIQCAAPNLRQLFFLEYFINYQSWKILLCSNFTWGVSGHSHPLGHAPSLFKGRAWSCVGGCAPMGGSDQTHPHAKFEHNNIFPD